MNPLKQFLIKILTDEQLLSLRIWKRRLLRQSLDSLPLSRSTAWHPVSPGDGLHTVNLTATNPVPSEDKIRTAEFNYGIDSSEASIGLLWPWNYEISKIPPRLPSGKRWPRISVVTVTFNQGAYLEETIRSVLMQGYPNLEYIVIDGDSSDNTRTILERYRHQFAVCISEPDKGQSDALNKGLSRATGEILAWLNSDDQYLPNTLRVVAEGFDRFETDMVVGGTVVIHNYRRSPAAFHHCVFPYDQVVILPLTELADFEGKWQAGSFFYQPEVFWTRSIWEKAGGRVCDELWFAMDYELWLRFARHGARVCHIPQNIAIFRMHDAQKTKWRLEEQYPEHIAVSRHYSSSGDNELSAPYLVQPVRPSVANTIPETVFDRRPIHEHVTQHGTFYLPADAIQDTVAQAIRSSKVARPEVLRLAEKYIAPGTIVLDVGAGFGQLSVLFSLMVGNAGQVLAFEADDYVFDILQRNIQANRRENIRAFLGAVFDDSRAEVVFPKAEYLRFPSYSSKRIDLAASGGRMVSTMAIDRLKIQAPVSFMHIHAPDSELHVLRGAVNTISRFQIPIAISADDSLHTELGTTYDDLKAFLRTIGYRIEVPIGSSCYLALPDASSSGAKAKPARSDPAVTGVARPDISVGRAPFRASLCKLLKSQHEVEECTRFLKRNGFVSHNLRCKDWDLAHIVPEIGDGNFLDMGSSDSYVLKNLSLKRIRGEKYGIDLQAPDVPISDVRYLVGDLMATGLPSGHFSNITCLSVLEHQVDFAKFASETSRLLVPSGRLFVTFDYWDPKVRPPIRLYGLEWQPLDSKMLRQFIATCANAGLRIIQDFDWELGEQVIRWGYYSPHPEFSYTFGMVVFEKVSLLQNCLHNQREFAT